MLILSNDGDLFGAVPVGRRGLEKLQKLLPIEPVKEPHQQTFLEMDAVFGADFLTAVTPNTEAIVKDKLVIPYLNRLGRAYFGALPAPDTGVLRLDRL